jgi:segregation and condensation protein A
MRSPAESTGVTQAPGFPALHVAQHRDSKLTKGKRRRSALPTPAASGPRSRCRFHPTMIAVDSAAPAAVPVPEDVVPPLAMIYGQPMLDMPHDLYIPPEALRVFLEAFEGPLDLLLYLIRKQNLDVLDIPMAALTRQYLEYVEIMRETQLELAAEYLLMAAVLIDIKSRMLLPRPPHATEDAGDPRAELVRRLLAYEQMKKAARDLDAMPRVDRDFERVEVWIEKISSVRLAQVRPEDLRAAWGLILQRAKVNRHHLISREQLTVRDQMTRLLRLVQPGQFMEFTALFVSQATISMVVVTFLAILELCREGLIDVAQAEAFAPIYVQLKPAEGGVRELRNG